MAVYFFYGDEDFNIELELEKMSSELNPDFKSMSYKTFDNPDFSTLINTLRTPPMMFGKILSVISMEKFLCSKQKSDDDSSEKFSYSDKELEEIEDALKNNQENSDIVFIVKIAREDGKKPDSRKKLFKILSKFNVKEFPVFKTYQTEQISNWVIKRAKSKKISLEKKAVNLLIEQIGNNLRDFDTELEKLVLIAHPDNKVTLKMVEDNCITNQDIFNFTKYIITGKKDKALLEFRKLLNKKYYLEILATLQTMLRKWIILKIKSSKSSFELSKLTGWTENKVNENLEILKNTKVSDLVKLKNNLFEAEYRLKTAESTDIISEVECAIIR